MQPYTWSLVQVVNFSGTAFSAFDGVGSVTGASTSN